MTAVFGAIQAPLAAELVGVGWPGPAVDDVGAAFVEVTLEAQCLVACENLRRGFVHIQIPELGVDDFKFGVAQEGHQGVELQLLGVLDGILVLLAAAGRREHLCIVLQAVRDDEA